MLVRLSARPVLAVLALAGSAAHAAPAKNLVIGLSQEPDTLHPLISTMTASSAIRSMAVRPVAAVNEVWKWECWLCTSIPTIENGGAKVIEEGGKKKMLVTWELRADAVWGDGEPVVGEDLRLAWRIGVAPTVVKVMPEAFTGIEDAVVDPKNPKRVTFKFSEVRYDFNQIDYSFVPIPSHIEGPIFERTKDQMGAYEKQTAYVTHPDDPGLYDGPYLVKEVKPSSHVLLVRNPRFAGKQPVFPQITFKVIPNTQALEANLMAGSVDMTGSTGVTFDQALAFKKRMATNPALAKRFKVTTLDDLIFEHVDFNMRDPIIAEKPVRQALMQAVDRTKLCQALFDGLQKPAEHAYHPLSPYFTAGETAYPYDLAKAQKLLDDAGWKLGPDGVRVKDGKRLALQIMTTSQNKVRELVQVHLQESWKRLGVALEIKNEPARVFFGETLRMAKYGQLGMYATTLNAPDDIQFATFRSDRVPTAENGWNGSNYMAWKNAKVDELLGQANTELDPAKRVQLVKGAIVEYQKDLPQLPLYYRAAVIIAPAALNPHQEGGVEYPLALRVERWTWDEAATTH